MTREKEEISTSEERGVGGTMMIVEIIEDVIMIDEMNVEEEDDPRDVTVDQGGLHFVRTKRKGNGSTNEGINVETVSPSLTLNQLPNNWPRMKPDRHWSRLTQWAGPGRMLGQPVRTRELIVRDQIITQGEQQRCNLNRLVMHVVSTWGMFPIYPRRMSKISFETPFVTPSFSIHPIPMWTRFENNMLIMIRSLVFT